MSNLKSTFYKAQRDAKKKITSKTNHEYQKWNTGNESYREFCRRLKLAFVKFSKRCDYSRNTARKLFPVKSTCSNNKTRNKWHDSLNTSQHNAHRDFHISQPLCCPILVFFKPPPSQRRWMSIQEYWRTTDACMKKWKNATTKFNNMAESLFPWQQDW